MGIGVVFGRRGIEAGGGCDKSACDATEVNVAAVVARVTEVTELMVTAVMAMNVLVWGGMASMPAAVLMTLLKLRETTQLKVQI